MLAFGKLRASNPQPPHHAYELRLYHAKEGKMDALKARFRDHTDAIFSRHNMKSIGYWSPEDAPDSQNLFIYILEHPSRQEAEKNWAAFQADPEWQKVKARIGGERTTGRSYRSLLHGSHQLFRTPLTGARSNASELFSRELNQR